MVIRVTILFPQIKTETSGSPSPLQVATFRPGSPRAWQVPRAVWFVRSSRPHDGTSWRVRKEVSEVREKIGKVLYEYWVRYLCISVASEKWQVNLESQTAKIIKPNQLPPEWQFPAIPMGSWFFQTRPWERRHHWPGYYEELPSCFGPWCHLFQHSVVTWKTGPTRNKPTDIRFRSSRNKEFEKMCKKPKTLGGGDIYIYTVHIFYSIYI